jgi:acyl-CoA thioesterase FadM
MRQEVFRPMPEAGVDKLLVRFDLRLACIDREFRPARLPPALKRALSHTKAI